MGRDSVSRWERWSSDLVMLLVAIIWALNNVVMKMALTGWASPSAFNTIRFSLGAVLLVGVTLLKEGSLAIPRSLLWKVMLLGVLGNGINQMLFVNGLALSSAINAAIFLGIVPILVALISGMLGLDRVTGRIWLGALISFGGLFVTLLAGGQGLHLGMGDLLLAGAVTAWAGYTVFARPLVQHVSPLRVTAVGMLSAASGLVLLNFPALLRQDYGAVTTQSWLGLFYAAALSNAVGYSLYVWAIRKKGPARVALYNNLGPVITAIGAWLILGERFGLTMWAGIFLVIIGVIFARWDDFKAVLWATRRSKRSEQPASTS
jgi:drug/metabolite transporter (DMT)-like permease